MVHRQLFNALVELALQIVSLLLQFLLFLTQFLQLVFALRDLGDVALDELLLLLGLAQRAQVFAHPLLVSGNCVYLALLLGDLTGSRRDLRLQFGEAFERLLHLWRQVVRFDEDLNFVSGDVGQGVGVRFGQFFADRKLGCGFRRYNDLKTMVLFGRLDGLGGFDQLPFLVFVIWVFDVDGLGVVSQVVERVDGRLHLFVIQPEFAVDDFRPVSLLVFFVLFDANAAAEVDGVGNESLLAGFDAASQSLAGVGVVFDDRQRPAFERQPRRVVEVERAHRVLFARLPVVKRDAFAFDLILQDRDQRRAVAFDGDRVRDAVFEQLTNILSFNVGIDAGVPVSHRRRARSQLGHVEKIAAIQR